MRHPFYRPWRIFAWRPSWLPRFLPFGRAVTFWFPWNPTPRVYIPWAYDGTGKAARARLHEPIHYDQWLELGRFGFLRKYLTPRGCLELEAPAFATNVWSRVFGGMNVSNAIDSYTDVLKKSYPLWGIDRSEVRETLRKAVYNRRDLHLASAEVQNGEASTMNEYLGAMAIPEVNEEES